MHWLIVFQDAEEEHPCSIYVASRSASTKSTLYIHRVVLDSINGVSSTRATSIAPIALPGGEVRQVQFVTDDTLMVLWISGRMSRPYSAMCISNY